MIILLVTLLICHYLADFCLTSSSMFVVEIILVNSLIIK